jgi:50S ribosomal protein L16 3-hydroxylase
LKILSNFEPEQVFDLEPGDMLYLPPRYAHDGIALGECMTYSIGFRSPRAHELAGELLQRLAHETDALTNGRLYSDRDQPAQTQPAKIPDQLVAFASDALSQMLNDRVLLAKCLGEHLTEPKPNVWFQAPDTADRLFDLKGVVCQLDRRTRMMYDENFLYINGESYRVKGRDAALLYRLADQRMLSGRDMAALSAKALAQVLEWLDAGWIEQIQE